MRSCFNNSEASERTSRGVISSTMNLWTASDFFLPAPGVARATRFPPATVSHGYAVKLILLPTIHVPARIHPLSFPVDEDFGHPAGVRAALAALFQIVRVV